MKNVKKVYLLMLVFSFSLLFCSCQNNTITNQNNTITKIYISATNEMEVGEKQIITVTNDIGTTNYDQYTFVSSNEDVVFIDENGCIYARAKGEAEITVFANGISEKILITVNDPPIEYIKNRQVFHKDDYQTFLFSFTDEDGNYLRSSGTAEIRIVNSNNVIVYNETLSFSESDFLNWTTTSYGNTYTFLGCGIKINDLQISKGNSGIGTLYVVVKAANANFKEANFAVSNLPINANVILTQTSGNFTEYNRNKTEVYSRATVKNANVDFEVTNTNKLRITITVNCICTYLSSNWYYSAIGYKVYDDSNNLVKTGKIQMRDIGVNQSWVDTDFFYLDIGNYTITLCDC